VRQKKTNEKLEIVAVLDISVDFVCDLGGIGI